METTSSKAKEIAPIIERLISRAMDDSLAARRNIAEFVTEPAVVKKLVEQIAPALKGRTGGYTRITKTRVRPGDAAELSIIELVK